VTFTDLLATALRDVVQTALGFADNTVQPANQQVPVGTMGEPRTIVHINSGGAKGSPDLGRRALGDEATEVEYQVNQYREFTAQIQVFRAKPAALTTDDAVRIDAAGIPEQSQWAFDQVTRLPDLLWLPAPRALLQKYGIAYLRLRGPARDIAEVDDSIWESRGVVELDFGIVNQEVARVVFLASARAQLRVAEGAALQTIDIEVTS
jgi:hypothetical protein